MSKKLQFQIVSASTKRQEEEEVTWDDDNKLSDTRKNEMCFWRGFKLEEKEKWQKQNFTENNKQVGGPTLLPGL